MAINQTTQTTNTSIKINGVEQGTAKIDMDSAGTIHGEFTISNATEFSISEEEGLIDLINLIKSSIEEAITEQEKH